MRPRLRYVVVLLAVCAAHALAGDPAAPGAVPSVDCRKMASAPGAVMSVDACEAQLAAMRNLQQSMSQPGGERAGDDQITCDQIYDELQRTQVTPPPREHVAESAAAGRDVQETQKRLMAEGAAMGAVQTARSLAVAAAPNAVQGVVAQANAAEQMAHGARTQAELAAPMARSNAANVAVQNDLVQSMASNPRMGRLTQLMMQKKCRFNGRK